MSNNKNSTINPANHNRKIFSVFENLEVTCYYNSQFEQLVGQLSTGDIDCKYPAGLVAVFVSPYQACLYCHQAFNLSPGYGNVLRIFFEEFISRNIDGNIQGLVNERKLVVEAEIATVTKILERIVGDAIEERFNEAFHNWIEAQLAAERKTDIRRPKDNSDLF